eukprot:7862081-Pyramimonas_sp.AAC.1
MFGDAVAARGLTKERGDRVSEHLQVEGECEDPVSHAVKAMQAASEPETKATVLAPEQRGILERM